MDKEKFNEDNLSEQPALEQLKRIGYSYIHGDQLDPELVENCERQSRRDVILEGRLRKKLAEINPHLTAESIEKAIRKITHIPEPLTFESNKIFHKYIIAGTSIDQDIGARRQHMTVNYVDFENIENNEFLVVNQFWVRKGKDTCRPDIVIFINGIPIVVIECKSPVAKNTGILDAQIQLMRYQGEIPQLFRTNEIIIGCNLFKAKYGTIDNPPEKFHEWRLREDKKMPNMAEHQTVKDMLNMGLITRKDLSDHPPMQEVLIAGLLRKENLLDIVRNFIVFDYSKEEYRVVKKICRYQQYRAVNKMVNRVLIEPHKRGIVWHWQGSGKSLIMIFAAIKFRREEKKLKNPIVLVVTDRKKLDLQIKENFENCSFPNPIQAKSMKKLYELLGGGTGATIMTTVQKFRKPLDIPLSKAENIIVMTDEAHRTQYGSFALNMRNALPNAAFFAFTGTPLNKKDRNTYRHFSPPGESYLDRYDIKTSEEEQATVPVKYESRLANLQIVGTTIDKLLTELFPDKTAKELAEIKRKYANIETIMTAPRRIERIAMDIVNHYNEKIAPNGFKAQIVAKDRDTVEGYKNALDKLIDPSWSTVIITVNNNDSKERKRKYRRTAEQEDELTGNEVFQNPNHPLKFLIVCDKMLTGYDAPILQVQYLDQRMKEHTLLQAIARTNRPYPRKNYGLVVDYAGVGKELAEALAIFERDDLQGIFSVDDIKNEAYNLKESLNNALSLFSKISREGKPADIIQQCMDILVLEDVRGDFDNLFRKISKSVDILMPDPVVNPFLNDFKFLGMIREAARNLYRDDRLSLENVSKKVEDLIHSHIRDLGIEEILAPINITAPDFKEKLAIKESDKAKASHMEQSIRETLKAKINEDPAFYEPLQDQLELLIKSERSRRISEAEFLKSQMKIKDQIERRELIAKDKGLEPGEFPFYGLFEPYKDTVLSGDDEKRIKIAKTVTAVLEKHSTIVDWIEREDIRKEIRRELKEILRASSFPDEKLELFVRELMQLAEEQFKDKNGIY